MEHPQRLRVAEPEVDVAPLDLTAPRGGWSSDPVVGSPDEEPAGPTPGSRAGRVWKRVREAIWGARADIAGASVTCVALLIVFAPVLIGGKTLSSAAYTLSENGFDPFPGQQPVGQHDSSRLDVSASALQFEPWAEVTASELRRGEIPLWNPYQAAGTPLAGNSSSAVFDPLLAGVHLHPTERTWDLTVITALLFGTVCAYILCRVLGMGYLAAVTGATAYSLSGYFFLFSNNPFIRGYSYLPLLCLLIEWIARSQRLLPVLLLSIATFGCITVGMPEIAFFVLLTAGSYAAWRAFFGPRSRRRGRYLGAGAAGFAGGILLAAPLLAVFTEYEQLSYNDHKGQGGGGLVTDAARGLLNWIVPFFNGQPLASTSPPGAWSGTRNWVGGAVVVLVLVALATRTRVAKLVVPFFGGVVVLILAKGYGLPVLDWVGRMPVVERVVVPAYGFPVVGFGLALMAAVGVDGIRRGRVRWSWFLAFVVVGGAALALVVRANKATLAGIPGSQVLQEFALPAVVVAVLVVSALVLRPRPAAYVATAAVVLELIVLAPATFAQRADPFRPTAWITALKAHLADHPYDRVFGLDASLYPNTAGVHQLLDVRMLDALYIDRYFRYVTTFIDPMVTGRFVGTHWGSSEIAPAYRGNQMFDLLGVRYIVAKQDLQATELSSFLRPDASAGVLGVQPASVGGETRTAIVQGPSAQTPLVVPSPFAGRLRFDYGVVDPAPGGPAAGGTSLSIVAIHRSGQQRTVWSDPSAGDLGAPGWRTAAVDIPASDDPVVQVALQSDATGEASVAWSAIDVEETAQPAPAPLEEVDAFGHDHIFENASAAARAFLVHQVTVVPDADAAQRALSRGGDRFGNGAVRVQGIDVKEAAVVEADGGEIPDALTKGAPCPADGPADKVTITRYTADEVRLEAQTQCAGLLVLSDTYFPGWHASVNGRSAPIHPTDLALRGVVVEPGRSEIVFRYQPASFRHGLLLAALAVLGMIGIAVVHLIRHRGAVPAVTQDRNLS